MAIYRPAPGLNERTFELWVLNTDGPLISASPVSHCGAYIQCAHTETATDSNASIDTDTDRTNGVPKEKDAEYKDSSHCEQRTWMRQTPRQQLAKL